MRRLVLGTAGHIDHGKTALVRALTGIDTDRLPDEKRRGITIDLGFANLVLPDGTTLSIVDVPGHEAFIRNMVAGATGIDLVMLVVAADAGVMPQTREHLAILELLDVRRGVIALTKTDLVEADWLELVRDELHDLLAATSLAGAPVIDVSARTGANLPSLTAALSRLAQDVPPRPEGDLFRMPIDRVFTVRGTGTVVTGTVWSGSLRRDAHVHVLPAGADARVRRLQQHGLDCDQVNAGSRAAVALSGVDRAVITRGDTLLAGDGWTVGYIITVQLQVAAGSGVTVRPRQRVRVHVGTAEVLGRVALLQSELEAGRSAIAQLRLESPLVSRAGDHLVIRSYSPVHTIGGGIVLEPAAPKRKRLSKDVSQALETMSKHMTNRHGPTSSAAHNELLQAAVVLAGPQGIDRRVLPIATGLMPAEVDAALRAAQFVTAAGGRVVSSDLLGATEEAIVAAVTAFHRRDPMADGMEREATSRELDVPVLFDSAVNRLLAARRLVAAGNALARPDFVPAPGGDSQAALARLTDIYVGAGLEPPEFSELPPDLQHRGDLAILIRYLERDGTLLRLSATRLISARAVAECAIALRSHLTLGQPLAVADFKEILRLTRKHLIPLLEHFDRTGVTRRTGEHRFLSDA